MKIGIIGPGAMGLLFAARLGGVGHEVLLVDYKAERAAYIDAEGIAFQEVDGSQAVVGVRATAQAEELARVELAIVCTKAYQTVEAAGKLAKHLPAAARALTLQNGVGNVETLIEALGPERVIGGTTSDGATVTGMGQVRHTGHGITTIGPAQGEPDEFTAAVVEALSLAGFETSAVAGVQNVIWSKLIVNVGINPIVALLDVRNGAVNDVPSAGELSDLAVAEALAVGRAKGIEFLHEDMRGFVRQVAQKTAENVNSMRADLNAPRPTEIGFINGAVGRYGREVGIATPVNDTLTLLVRAREELARS